MLGENVEAFAPAFLVAVARAGGVEAALFEGDLGPAAEILEPHRHERLVTGNAVLFPGVRHHQQPVRNDLAIDAAEPKLVAVRVRACSSAICRRGADRPRNTEP